MIMTMMMKEEGRNTSGFFLFFLCLFNPWMAIVVASILLSAYILLLLFLFLLLVFILIISPLAVHSSSTFSSSSLLRFVGCISFHFVCGNNKEDEMHCFTPSDVAPTPHRNLQMQSNLISRQQLLVYPASWTTSDQPQVKRERQ